MLYAKPCCAVDPIENEEDRKKVTNSLHKLYISSILKWERTIIKLLFSLCTIQAVTNINTLLDKADRVYHQLMGHRPQLESLLSKVNEAAPEKPQVSQHVTTSTQQAQSVSCVPFSHT